MNRAMLVSGAAILLAASAGCERRSDAPAPSTSTTTRQPDNTGRNAVDRDGTTKTPPDQKENQSDVRITADIRRAITDDNSMSVNARNCKIVTQDGVVTLRGPVESQAEKDAIEAKAKAVAGVSRIDNQLEVKPG